MTSSAPLSKLEERIAKLDAASESIRDATREAHEAIQTLRLLRREISHLLDTDVQAVVEAAINDQVRVGLDRYAKVITEAQEKAVAHVGSLFDELARIYIGEIKHPDSHLPTLAARRRREREGT